MSDHEKRSCPRHALVTPAWFGTAGDVHWRGVDLLDISTSGAGFKSADPVAVGASYGLRFFLPDNPHCIECTVQIMYCMPHNFLGGYRVGAHMTTIDPAARQMIDELITTAAAS